MNTFHLRIVTPEGMFFDGQAEKVIVRTTEGDVCILCGHSDYTAPLTAGQAKVTTENGDTKTAQCSGGLISVKKGITRLVANIFEWTEEI